MTSLTPFLLIIVIIIFSIGIYNAWGESVHNILELYSPDEIVWVGGDNPRQVMIFYLDVIPCGDSPYTQGCFNPMYDTIFIKTGKGHQWAMPGCSIRDHEIYHAWGFTHVTMNIFNCPNPNVDYEIYQYNEFNIKHKDLTDDHWENPPLDYAKACYVNFWNDCQ